MSTVDSNQDKALQDGNELRASPDHCHTNGTDVCRIQTDSNTPIIKTEQQSPRPQAGVHMGMRFTNFFIDEILKPNFGKTEPYQHPSPESTFESEYSLLSQQFSSIVHRPIPTFKQTSKLSVQSAALDLRQDKVIKKDKTRNESTKSPVSCERTGKTAVADRLQHSSLSSTPPQSPSPASSVSSTSTSPGSAMGVASGVPNNEEEKSNLLWPAWVYCTRYSDRPSSGPRSRRNRRKEKAAQEKRPRTAFSAGQLEKLKREFEQSRYLTEPKRQDLARELNLNESQIKIWFQNKRAKLKKATGVRNGLALHLMAQGLYNHSTLERKEDEEIDVES